MHFCNSFFKYYLCALHLASAGLRHIYTLIKMTQKEFRWILLSCMSKLIIYCFIQVFDSVILGIIDHICVA